MCGSGNGSSAGDSCICLERRSVLLIPNAMWRRDSFFMRYRSLMFSSVLQWVCVVEGGGEVAVREVLRNGY